MLLKIDDPLPPRSQPLNALSPPPNPLNPSCLSDLQGLICFWRCRTGSGPYQDTLP